MLKREEKVLLYIKRHPDVTRKKLLEKFPSYDSLIAHVSGYVWVTGTEEVIYKGRCTGSYEVTDNSKYRLSRNGEQYFEDKSNRFWSFFLPYGITTAIAIASLVAQFIGC